MANQPQPQPQPMSSTAGPIASAMGLGSAPATPNFTGGLAPVKPPKFKPMSTMDPLAMTNQLQGYQNQANDANNQRYNQALGVMGQGQDSANSLYGQARSDIGGIGTQANQRIDLNLQNQLGQVQQNAINTGLNNSTIADTMTYMPQRQAADAHQGVSEMQAGLYSGLDTQQAGSQTGYANNIANLIGSRNDQAPNTGLYSQLMQQAAAGNFGKAPHMSGSVSSMPAATPPGRGGTSSGGSASSGPFGNGALAGTAGSIGGGGGSGGGGGGGTASGMGGADPSMALGVGYMPNGYQDLSPFDGGLSGFPTGPNDGGVDNNGMPASSTPNPVGSIAGAVQQPTATPGYNPAVNGPVNIPAAGGSAVPDSAQSSASPTTAVSPAQSSYYSMLYGANWQQMMFPGQNVSIDPNAA